ncbi:DUF1878 family protein [Bacillus sp. FJAT-45350]|uniref:DUF1878 family protein n=1 Tax=Bacillus sp. FJAT-45350 TaxID=2011014 RepID=UPI000BB96A2F|nr:DUF1878 family protein [Bacillus sp. FJAT-45350]
MESLDAQVRRLGFYQTLLLDMVDTSKFPFYQLVIRNGVTEEEMKELFILCNELNELLEEQRELGYVRHTSLLVHFVGMLTIKLKPKAVIEAMQQQSLYGSLMDVLLKALIEHNIEES